MKVSHNYKYYAIKMLIEVGYDNTYGNGVTELVLI